MQALTGRNITSDGFQAFAFGILYFIFSTILKIPVTCLFLDEDNQ